MNLNIESLKIQCGKGTDLKNGMCMPIPNYLATSACEKAGGEYNSAKLSCFIPKSSILVNPIQELPIATTPNQNLQINDYVILIFIVSIPIFLIYFTISKLRKRKNQKIEDQIQLDSEISWKKQQEKWIKDDDEKLRTSNQHRRESEERRKEKEEDEKIKLEGAMKKLKAAEQKAAIKKHDEIILEREKEKERFIQEQKKRNEIKQESIKQEKIQDEVKFSKKRLSRKALLTAIDYCEENNIGSKSSLRRLKKKYSKWFLENERDVEAARPDYELLLEWIEEFENE